MATDDPQHDESSSTQTTALTVLRWIAFIPAALLSCVVGRFVFVLINRWGMIQYGAEPGTFVWRIFDQYVSGLVLGAIFVYVSAYVAPSKKKPVAVVGAAIVLVLGGFLLFPSILVGEYWAIFEIICMGLGACGVAHAIFADEITFDSQ